LCNYYSFLEYKLHYFPINLPTSHSIITTRKTITINITSHIHTNKSLNKVIISLIILFFDKSYLKLK